jgi:hypothetical protein
MGWSLRRGFGRKDDEVLDQVLERREGTIEVLDEVLDTGPTEGSFLVDGVPGTHSYCTSGGIGGQARGRRG